MQTRNFPGISSLKRRRNVISVAITVHGRTKKNTWTLKCSKTSLMKLLGTAREVSHSIYLESPCYIPTSWTGSDTSKNKTGNITLSSPQTEPCLTSLSIHSSEWEWMKSSGRGAKKQSSKKKLLKNSRKQISESESSKKSPHKKKSKNGRTGHV